MRSKFLCHAAPWAIAFVFAVSISHLWCVQKVSARQKLVETSDPYFKPKATSPVRRPGGSNDFVPPTKPATGTPVARVAMQGAGLAVPNSHNQSEVGLAPG